MVFITVCISEHGVIFPLRKSIFRCNVFGNLVTGLFLRVQLRDTWLDNQIEMSWNVIVDYIHVLSLMSVWAFEVVCRSLSLSAPHVVSIHLFHFKHSFFVSMVLYVPGLGVNLLSIAAVTEVGINAYFKESYVNYNTNEKTIIVGKRIGGKLYLLAITATKFWRSGNFSRCLQRHLLPSGTNVSLIELSNSKHIHIRYHFIRWAQEEKEIDVRHI